MTQPRRITRTVSIAAAAALACALAVSIPSSGDGRVLAGDAKIAETLFKSGKQALQKGDAEGAISFFKKAREENADLVEAVWWTGSAQEKAGDKAAALTSYREYLAVLDTKTALTPATKEELRLKALAEKSVAAMAAGEREFQKLEDTYVAGLLQIAKTNFTRDPGAALRALDALLAVRPADPEAVKLREKLSGGGADTSAAKKAPSGPETTPEPFKAVAKWKDLIALKIYKSLGATFGEGTMILETKGGELLTPGEPTDPGPNFAYEADLLVAETFERTWLTGLTFGLKGTRMYAAFMQASSVKLIRVDRSGASEDLKELAVPPFDVKAWHRIGVLVKGPDVQVWVDGKALLTWTHPDGAAMSGEVGIFQQGCRTERRVFRAGSLD